MSEKLNKSGLQHAWSRIKNYIDTLLGTKQDTLVSGTNVKTINNESILGSGNLTISGGLQNLVDGSKTGSVRNIGASSESSDYTIGLYAFAEGSSTKASSSASHAEGSGTTASGSASHAEGSETIASGMYSHAEGERTTASGDISHAEGSSTKASSSCSHAEGSGTTASGMYSHAQNLNTIAAKDNQTAIGKYNVEDTQTDESKQKAFIIGNGTGNNARSNAFTVDWSGNVDIASGASYKINGMPLSASDVDAQPTLVSGTNIKTVDNKSILGSGNLTTNNTWQANTREQDGYVPMGAGNFNCIWRTDSNGAPSWGTLTKTELLTILDYKESTIEMKDTEGNITTKTILIKN